MSGGVVWCVVREWCGVSVRCSWVVSKQPVGNDDGPANNQLTGGLRICDDAWWRWVWIIGLESLTFISKNDILLHKANLVWDISACDPASSSSLALSLKSHQILSVIFYLYLPFLHHSFWEPLRWCHPFPPNDSFHDNVCSEVIVKEDSLFSPEEIIAWGWKWIIGMCIAIHRTQTQIRRNQCNKITSRMNLFCRVL